MLTGGIAENVVKLIPGFYKKGWRRRGITEHFGRALLKGFHMFRARHRRDGADSGGAVRRAAMGIGVMNKKEGIIVSLASLKPGQSGRVTGIKASGPMKRRLMDMGVLVGEVVKVEKVAPLGDPIEVSVKNYRLSFRKKEAEGILVEV